MSITTFGDISPRTAAYAYSRFLRHVEPTLVLAKFGQVKAIPKNKSTTVKFRRALPYPAVTSPLQEGVTPSVKGTSFEDVTTNAKGRENDPIENTWGALHEYHHVFQMAHCDTTQSRFSEKNIHSWMAEGMASYSSAKFMENLGLIDFNDYMLELKKSGANIGRPSINAFVAKNPAWKLENEDYWEEGGSAQVYYMIGAWATAYLIHVQKVPEVVVLKKWYFDIPKLGKAAAFKKHMGLSLNEFYQKFRPFILQSDEKVMQIFGPSREK